MKETIIQRK